MGIYFGEIALTHPHAVFLQTVFGAFHFVNGHSRAPFLKKKGRCSFCNGLVGFRSFLSKQDGRFFILNIHFEKRRKRPVRG
jgi:hypothetical protein